VASTIALRKTLDLAIMCGSGWYNERQRLGYRTEIQTRKGV